MPAPRNNEQLSARLVAVAVFGLVLILPPILVRFNHMTEVLGVPVLWAYLFLAWAMIIGLIAILVRR